MNERPRTWVYFLQAGENGPIKIGFTGSSPMVRLAALQTGNPERLRLLAAVPGTREDEGNLHERFSHLGMQGEWFRSAPDLSAFIAGVLMGCRGQPESYDDMFEWDEWLDDIAEYCQLWQAERRIEQLDIAEGVADSYGEGLSDAEATELEMRLDAVRLAWCEPGEGAKRFGFERAQSIVRRGTAIVERLRASNRGRF